MTYPPDVEVRIMDNSGNILARRSCWICEIPDVEKEMDPELYAYYSDVDTLPLGRHFRTVWIGAVQTL